MFYMASRHLNTSCRFISPGMKPFF